MWLRMVVESMWRPRMELRVAMASRRSWEIICLKRWKETDYLQVELFAKTFYLGRSLFEVYRCPEARLAMKEFGFCYAQYLSIREGNGLR